MSHTRSWGLGAGALAQAARSATLPHASLRLASHTFCAGYEKIPVLEYKHQGDDWNSNPSTWNSKKFYKEIQYKDPFDHADYAMGVDKIIEYMDTLCKGLAEFRPALD